jgi:hypothetical protein
MALRKLFGFTNISENSLLHILGYSFCAKHHILVHFWHELLQLYASKIILAKAALSRSGKRW